MNLSANGAALVAEHEGKVNTLYNDPVGHCTIGIGHLVHRGNCDGSEPAEFKRGLSDQEVYDLFIQDAQRYVDAVNRLVSVPLNQNQFDALVCFTFNVGEGAFGGSTLLRKLNAGDYTGAAEEFGKWVKADDKTLPGLVSRRAAERALFLSDGEEMVDIEHLHPVFRERVLAACNATGSSVYSGARSTERQRELYEGYNAGKPGYNPANPPGTSWHEYGEGIPGGVWALAVDFNEPYPHGQPGLSFPIAGEPWHGQPSEITEPSRVRDAETRLPQPYLPVPVSNKELPMEFTYIANVTGNPEDFVYLGVEGFHGRLPFGDTLDTLKKSKQLSDLGQQSPQFHEGVKALADTLGFLGDA